MGKKGISAFTEYHRHPWVRGRPYTEHKMGIRASDTCAVTLSQLGVPEPTCWANAARAAAIALSNLEGGRIGIAAQALGIARAAFEAALGLCP